MKPSSKAAAPPANLSTFDAFAVAAPGVAPLLGHELRALGMRLGEISTAGVEFSASYDELIAVNLWSRLATRVLVRIASFTARDFATLEKQAQRIVWSRVIAPDARVRFRVTCRKSRLYHSDAVAERVARAVAKAVPSATVLERSRGDEDDELIPTDASSLEQLIVVRIEHDQCTISADSSGELLHRRGWRQAIAKAPLRETLAAAMLAACEWQGDVPLVDPFCGSGTIGIEAALLARGIAPGLTRSFAMERWPGVSRTMVATQRASAREAARPSTGIPIIMSDRDLGACDAARANAERAGVLGDMEIWHRPLSATDLSEMGPRGLVLTNPPYGLRVSEGLDLRSLYARLGDVVRSGGPAWQLAMLVPDKRLAGQTGLSFESVMRTSNGGIGVMVERSKVQHVRAKTARTKRPPAVTPEGNPLSSS